MGEVLDVKYIYTPGTCGGQQICWSLTTTAVGSRSIWRLSWNGDGARWLKRRLTPDVVMITCGTTFMQRNEAGFAGINHIMFAKRWRCIS
jgi:hypothetical protein